MLLFFPISALTRTLLIVLVILEHIYYNNVGIPCYHVPDKDFVYTLLFSRHSIASLKQNYFQEIQRKKEYKIRDTSVS